MPTIQPQVVCEGCQKKVSIVPANSSIYSLPDVIGTFSGTVFSGQMKHYIFLATDTRGEFDADTKIAMQKSIYPHCEVAAM